MRPIMPVTLAYAGQVIVADALLDSGADANVLPYHLGQRLGMDWDKARPVPALSGNLAQAEARAIALDIIVNPFEPVRMVFMWVKTDTVRLLLGQINFFQAFHVCFFAADGYFEVQSHNEAR